MSRFRQRSHAIGTVSSLSYGHRSSVFGAVEAREGGVKHSEDAEKIRVYVKHQEKREQLTEQGKLRF